MNFVRTGWARVRALAPLAAFGLAVCAEPAALRSGAHARLAIQPVFASAVADAAASVDHIHIVLTRPPSTKPLADEIIAIPAGADSVAISLEITLQASSEDLLATVDLLSSGVVLYHGSSPITVHADNRKTQAPTVAVAYVGPGATARSITVAPANATIPANGTQAFTATVTDASGASIPGVPLRWSLSDNTLGTIAEASGAFTGAGKRGTVTVTATTLGGVAGSTTLTLSPVATKLTLVSGDAQSAPAGSPLPQPIVVEADGVDGPVSGVTVNFSTTGGGSITPAQAVTDANGRATARATLGTKTGAQPFTASATGLSTVTANATATAVATTIAKVSGDAQSDSVGRTLQPFVVKVTDAFGNAAPGATVNWAIVGGAQGTLSGTSSTTDASGQASVTYTLSKVPRTDAVSATLNGTTSSVLFTAVAFQRGPANLQVVSGDAQSGVAGSVLPARFEVKATDVLGNPVSGVTVAFAAATGGGSVSPTTATTGTTGTAATTMTLGGLVGPQRFTASAGSLTASVTATATAGMVSHLLYVSGNGQADTACATLKVPLVVQATDAFGNGVSGVTVTWQQVGGPGSANSSPASLTTDSLGYSAVSYRLSSAAGVDTLVAALQVTTAMPITFYETATTSARSSCASPQRAPSTAPALGQRAPGAPSVPSGSSWQPVTGFLPGRGRP